ncbi:MAG: hypothetical protein LBN23_03940 [Paludibacter sp.]|jgi:hypothetical protein|nr:hypothetical protein [Paludibacter sp.]
MEELEKITYDVLAERALYPFDSKKLVYWAIDVLMLGKESENLCLLAGLDNDTTEEREEYFLKSLNDIKFEKKKSEKELIEIYAKNLAKKAVNGEINIDVAFKKMVKVFYYSDDDSKYSDFFEIDEDLDSLKYDNTTLFISELTLDNYKEYILEEFKIFIEMQDLQIPNAEREKCYCLKCKKFTKPTLKNKYGLFKKPFKYNVWSCEFCKSEKLKYSTDHFVKKLLIEKYKEIDEKNLSKSV